jgi:hypothetical protein
MAEVREQLSAVEDIIRQGWVGANPVKICR